MAPITGGCHYDGGCGRFSAQCGHCPQLSSNSEEDLSRAIWRRKQTALSTVERTGLHLVALSRWMAKQVRQSSLMRSFPLTIIPNGVDLGELMPRNRALARRELGVPADARVILFAAETVNNPRKGFDHLVRALAGTTELDRPFLLSVGYSPSASIPDQPVRHLGFVENTRLLSMVYSAADIYVIPSIEDNFPNTAVEAMACGTPVVGYDVGGLSDIIRPGLTGDLVPQGQYEALRTALVALLGNEERLAMMGQNCRSVAEEEYGIERQARSYLELYRQVIASHAAARACGSR
jgi:glycosyltransferase involved in cell wall biosynthesis